jgi:molybdopterin/thiamine biosynthesis adenylyltransferase/rhodanese-related sulfurtransferase
MTTLSQEELSRYVRHLTIPDFGIAGQERLRNTKVLVIGAGGLGCPVLLYLAAAGIGHIGIVDYDRIEKSNLQRQVLYAEDELGQYKAEVAANKLQKLNPLIDIKAYLTTFNSQNALPLIAPYDIVVDGTDNFPTRYLINDACILAGKVYVYGSIYRFEGQLAVFNHLLEDGTRSPNYRDLFPTPPPPELAPNCAEGGVLGVLPGIIGCLQANEVIKLASGTGQPLVGKLHLFDAATLLSRSIRIRPRTDYEVSALIDYEQFCNPAPQESLPELSADELSQLLKTNAGLQLIDVREAQEHRLSNIGGINITVKNAEQQLEQLQTDQAYVLYCRSGRRSAQLLQQMLKAGFHNSKHLRGGLEEWKIQIDPGLIL